MKNEQVISLRDTLKAGKNYPLRISVDNSLQIIDEANKFQFTKWDDINGILYSFKMINLNMDRCPNNNNQAISIISLPYELIQSMEISFLPIDEISNVIDSIRTSGCQFGEDFEKVIIHTFKEVLAPDRITLTPSDINSILGPNAVNDKDDYYYNKYIESAKETQRYKEHNNYVDELGNNG